MDNDNKKLLDALYKKALGYTYEEITEEFTVTQEDGEKLIKRKKSTKNVPPDLASAKLLIEISNENGNEYEKMTDEELDKEIERIKTLLKNIEENPLLDTDKFEDIDKGN